MKRLLLFTIAITIIIACSSAKEIHRAHVRCEARYRFPDQTSYDVSPEKTTKTNIAVDTSGLNINLDKIDRLTSEVEECLSKLPPLSKEDVMNGQCVSATLELPIKRECLTVKVASDWFLSKYEYNGTHHQQLPYTNGGQCSYKGLPTGVCWYRCGIQDNLTIVVPPSFYLYKDPLVRIATGCANPWYVSSLANCMEPTTSPLGDGTEP